MSVRYLFLLICGILLAGIVHISIILLIPNFGSRDAWNIISDHSAMWKFRKFSDNEVAKQTLEETDPYFKMGACTFDLDEAGLRISGSKSVNFWSVSVFDQSGSVIYSLNNRTAIDNQLDLIVLNPLQMVELRQDPPKNIQRSVVVEAEIANGFVVLRNFQNDVSDKDSVDKFLDLADCGKYPN